MVLSLVAVVEALVDAGSVESETDVFCEEALRLAPSIEGTGTGGVVAWLLTPAPEPPILNGRAE